ncbi:sialate O-acetylesterase [Paenibacillus sp. Soil766]|uniref:sialate O-acetylesterase n=1 Tax=Paenibacillus sp. Soil766 TaxID=1736404 RepID=UPI000AC5ACBC|nr:sialate O-acetylesterase [Paenibacillus sp. Soil766]
MDLNLTASNCVGQNEVDLIMFMGQSNMAGRGTAAQAPAVAAGTAYEFRAISDPTQLYPLSEPFGENENNASGITEPGAKTGSMVSAFVNAYFGVVGRKVVAVSAAKGGSSITLWQPGGAYLNDAIARYNTAKNWLTSNGYTIKNKFMVWCQGETDGDNAMSGANYAIHINCMIDAMITTGLEKCYIVRIGNHRDNATLYDSIITVQTELCRTHSNMVLVSTKFAAMATAGLMKDQFHYTQAGYNAVGADAGINTAFHIMTKKEPCMYDLVSATMYFSYK